MKGGGLHVLLTNDDGIDATGLKLLREELRQHVARVTTIAPDANRSGVSRSISFGRPVAVTRVAEDASGPSFACSGSPVDCVRVGLLSELLGPVDLVVAGINHGHNVGDDVAMSGTVGAAMEAALLGVAGVALSQQGDDGGTGDFRFNDTGFLIRFPQVAAAVRIALAAAAEPPPARTILSVNLPARPASPTQVRHTRPGRRYYRRGFVCATRSGGDEQAFHTSGLPADSSTGLDEGEDTDFAALRAGHISASVLRASAEATGADAADAWFGRALGAIGAA